MEDYETPESLGDAGRELWQRVVDDLDENLVWEEKELHLLESACRVRDQIAALDERVAADGQIVTGARGTPLVHPGLQEARQLRMVELRLLKAIGTKPVTAASRSAKHAADVRWARERRSA